MKPLRFQTLLQVSLAIALGLGFAACSNEKEPESGAEQVPGGVNVPREKLDELAALSETKGAYAQVCAACHGPDGAGNEELKAPSIAGLPAWYIKEQFAKFREGKRGAHQDDAPGQQMRAIALSLTEAQIEEAAEAVSKLPIVLTELPPEEADLERGRYLFANECMECHRYNGKGEVVFHSAQLISLNRSYLRRQLKNFHAEKRGAAEDDIYGNKMVDVTSRLSDEDIEILVDYIGALAHGDDPRPAREL
ncbi:MAG: c-type cytochrome [Verrucomicrobiales bacterium]|nr:c-type cytochrome [Verrucomicrobiales bacterium]